MRIVLLDTGFSALPIYEYLTSISDDVWVMGNRETDIIARHAGTKWIKQDYSQIDEVKAIINHHNFDRIVPGCTDVSMDSCVKINPDSPFHDNQATNDLINNKDLFRKLCNQLDLPAPRAFNQNEFPLPGKYICKPVDAFSGRGVSLFNGENLDQLTSACQAAMDASQTQKYIIENFVEGPLYSCTGFMENHVLTNIFFVREAMSNDPFAVDTSYVVMDFPEKVKKKLVDSLNTLSSHLNMKDGLLHTQFILNEDKPIIIEATRRCPGDLYSLLIEYSTGFNYAAKYASYYLGLNYDAHISQNKYILRHTITPDCNSIYNGLKFLNTNYNIYNIFPLLTIGEILYPSSKCRVGVMFCQADSNACLNTYFNHFITRKAYVLSKNSI